MAIKNLTNINIYNTELNTQKPLLHAWKDSIIRYCRLQEHDKNPWYYGERANISILAGAAWTLPEWAAIEEFATFKKNGKKEKNGRCDLYVRTKDKSFAFEAKHVWQGLSTGGKRRIASGRQTATQKGMISAWNDAGTLQVFEGDMRLTATFVVPKISARKVKPSREEIKIIIEKWQSCESFKFGQRSPDAVAHVYPEDGDGFLFNGTQCFYPGVTLVIYRRQKAAKGIL